MSQTTPRPGLILIVDDDDNNLALLSGMLESKGYSVIGVGSGESALEAFRRNNIDLVLMDLVMPGMGGLDATRSIKVVAGDRFVPIIFHSFLEQEEVLADCVAAGGDDFLNKPYNRVVLNAKVDAMLRLARLHETVRVQRDELVRHREWLQREHEVAEQVFAKVAHPGCLDLWQIRYLLSPTSIVNGDILLAARQPDGGVLVMIADGSGHGLPAAVTALPAAEVFHAMARKGFPIEEIVPEINTTLRGVLPADLYLAACLFHLDEGGRVLQAWNGGMPDLLVVTGTGTVRCRIESTHLPLGVIETSAMDVRPVVEKVFPGERVYGYSDGLIETHNPQGKRFGVERLMRCFDPAVNPEHWFDAIQQALETFREGKPPSDDTALVEVVCAHAFAPYDESGPYVVQSRRPPLSWRLELELIPKVLREMQPIPGLVQALVDVQGLEAHRERLYVVLAELYSNALEHGLLELDSQLKADAEGFHHYYEERARRLAELDAGHITIELAHFPSDQGGEVRVAVQDSGKGFDLADVETRLRAGIGYQGRGISLVRNLCRQLSYPGNGNRAEAKYRWS